MTDQPKRSRFATDSIAAPLRHAVFRRIWLASLVSNLGILIQGVGAAWAMTQMTSSADKVALVQTALMLPVMLISMPAGAIADMHDRRNRGAGLALHCAVRRDRADGAGMVQLGHPNVLLALCFVVGSGMALFGPAWQASVSEQVPAENAAVGGRPQRHQLQHRAQLWPSDRRHRGPRPQARSRPLRSTRCFICR